MRSSCRSSCRVRGPGELVERTRRGGEAAAESVHLGAVRVPLLPERPEHVEDLRRGALHPEALDRLAHDREHREEREGRAHHDPVAEGIVEERRRVLLHERVQLLVRDEEEHAVDARLGASRVLALPELFDLGLHVLQEVVPEARLLELGLGVDVPDVVVERELHVHVEDGVLGQEEREVGDARALRDGLLLAVLDAFHEPGEAQHVLGHALAPLAPGLAAGKRLAQALRGGRQLGDTGPLLRQCPRELLDLGAPAGLELPDEGGDLVQLAAHVPELRLDEIALGRQRLAGTRPLPFDERAVRLDQVPQRRLLLLGGALGDPIGDVLRIRCGRCVGRVTGDDERAGAGGGTDGEHEEQGDEQDADHAPHLRTGV